MEKSPVSVVEHEIAVYVTFANHVRVDVAALLRDELLATSANKDVLIDWEHAEHVDASVLQVLIACGKSRSALGSSLLVEKDNPRVREYLRISGLSEVFPLVPQSHPASRRDSENV